MTVWVDELKIWPTKIRCFKGGSAHLTADTLDELHAFAQRLGLKRAWFQPHPIADHYDLTSSKHALALELGATVVSAREQSEARIAARRARALADCAPLDRFTPPASDERLAALEREDRETAATRDAVRPRKRGT